MQRSQVVIIGAGISGLCMAINLLKNRDIHDIVILEKGAGIGGTWFDNTYPGACCDVWCHLYSFSFQQNHSWTRLYPTQKEILAYLISVAEFHGLYKYIRFNSEVRSCEWSDERGTWKVDVKNDGNKDKQVCKEYSLESDFLISCVGQLNYPHLPDIPGLDDGSFKGRIMHSARWDWNYDYAGKRVAIVGAGATAAQIIPEVVKTASHVTVYQRSPNWVFDRHDATISPMSRFLFRYIPFWQKRLRALMMNKREEFHQLVANSDSKISHLTREMTSRKLLEAFPQDVEMRKRLTPDFDPGCKRVILSDDYLLALSHPNCVLEKRPIARIVGDGIEVMEEGVESSVEAGSKTEFDLIVLATGFRAVDHLYPIKITGTGNRSLSEIWDKGARALYGVMLEDMPNFGILYGPNTNLAHNSLILQIETQARYIAALVKEVAGNRREGEKLNIAPRKDVLRKYNEDLQHRLKDTSFADSRCTSWFKDQTGTITTNWYGTAVDYQKMMSVVYWTDFVLSGSGAEKYKNLAHTKIGRVVEETSLTQRKLCLAVSGVIGACFGLLTYWSPRFQGL